MTESINMANIWKRLQTKIMSEDMQRRKDWRKYLKTPLAEKLTLSVGALFFQKADDSFEPKFFQPEEFEKPCLAIAAAMAGSCYLPRLNVEDIHKMTAG